MRRAKRSTAARLLRHGRVVRLRPQAIRALEILAARAGRCVEYDELMAEAWPGVAVSRHTVDVTVAEVRRALAPGGALVLSECVRPFPSRPVYIEFLFNLLEAFRAPRLVEPWRPNGGFLTPEQWTAALEACGFRDVTGQAERFEYWSLARQRGGDGFGYSEEPILEGAKKSGIPRADFLPETERYLDEAIARWILGSEPFTARLNPDIGGYNDYDQLMRLDEWLPSLGGGGG